MSWLALMPLGQLACTQFCSFLLPGISVLPPALPWVPAASVLRPSFESTGGIDWLVLMQHSLSSPLGQIGNCSGWGMAGHNRRPISVEMSLWSMLRAASPLWESRVQTKSSLGFVFFFEKFCSPTIVKWAHVEIAVICRVINQVYCLCSRWHKDAMGYAELPKPPLGLFAV